jgi:hypothetical protein
VLGWTEILTDAADPEQVRRGIHEIRAAATGSSRLTQQLLAFSRPDLQAPTRVELDSVLPSVITSYRRLMPGDIAVLTKSPFFALLVLPSHSSASWPALGGVADRQLRAPTCPLRCYPDGVVAPDRQSRVRFARDSRDVRAATS